MLGPAFKADFDQLAATIEQFIQGNDRVVRLALVCLLAEGHLLIEGPPGVAKTSLAKAIAESIQDADVKRIQFTPDLLPADVTGSRIYHQASGEFPFEKGPVFTNVLIADEINRASPRTQSALLEVMAERQVTVDGKTHPVPDPFLCVATQNPLEFRGTFPLPEAQIDRFMMKVTMSTPDRAAELEVLNGGLDRRTPRSAIEAAASQTGLGQVKAMIKQAGKVFVDDSVKDYVLDIVAATRPGPSNAAGRTEADIAMGVSPRAAIALALTAQAHAASVGRDYVAPDDVKEMAIPVLAHRLVLSPAAADRGLAAESVIAGLLKRIRVPSGGQRTRTPAARGT